MIFQPTNIIPDEVNGSGCVDLSDQMKISWQLNGDSALTAVKLDFYMNDAESTFIATSGKVTVAPTWGRKADGSIYRPWVSLNGTTLATLGITNGNEYKFVLTQYWGDESDEQITQLTASVFYGRTAPIVTIDAFTDPVETKAYTFTGTYSQTEGDSIDSIQWLIAEEGYEDDPLLDTGKIYGTGILSVSYDGFLTGVRYGIRCIVITQSKQEADTGWQYFDVDYEIETSTGSATACQLAEENAVFIQWDQMEEAQGYSVMRRVVGQHRLKKIADVDATVGQIRDYSAKSGETYIYYVYPEGQTTYITGPQITNQVTISYKMWALIEAETEDDGSYFVLNTYYFRYGDGGVKEGDISNNNLPTILKNFTRYPLRQSVSSNYKTGSITGYVGKLQNTDTTRLYSDTVAEVDALMELATTQNHLFLSDPKGHMLAVHSFGEITAKTDVKKHVLPQTLTFPWIEVASSDDLIIISEPGHQFYAQDAIISTAIAVRVSDGALIWTTPDNYQYGSTLTVSANGALIQNVDGSFTAAEMEISEDMILSATLSSL